MANPTVDSRTFVIAWMESNNAAEVAKKLGMKQSTVTQRASSLRKKGVPLKYFTQRSPRNDYDELAALVMEHESEADKAARLKREGGEDTEAPEDDDTEYGVDDTEDEDFSDFE